MRALLSLFVIVFLLAPPAALAWDKSTDPAVEMGLLLDPSRGLGLDEVLATDPAMFRPLPNGSVNLGYMRDAAWVRLVVKSEGDQPLLMSLSPNFTDFIDVYVARDRPGLAPTDFTHFEMGDHRPLLDDGVSSLDDVVPLDLAPGETARIYIRLAAVGSALTSEITFYPRNEQALRLTSSALGYGVWFGSMAVLMVIQLVFFYFDRKPYYLLLAIATFMAGLVYTGTLGLSRLFLFPGGGDGNDMFVAATIWLGLVASGLAGDSILELRRVAPRLHLVFLGCIGIGAVGAVVGLLGGHLTFAPVGNAVGIALAALGAFQGVRTADSDGVATQLRAAAYVALAIGTAATLTQRSAMFDLPSWVTHAYAVACVVQTILLTAALGVRLRRAEALNGLMREEALVTARRAEHKANALVEERTRELASARQVAEEALRAELASQQQQVRFMEVISHQYRTPLAAIRTHADNIGLNLPTDDVANQQRLDRVRRGIVRLIEVLEVNLSRARLQGPAFQPKLVSTPLGEIVTAAAARGRDLLQKPIESDIAAAAEPVRILADADMLGIAIINLLENAVKFSAGAAKAPVTLSCVAGDGEAVIAVADHGIGIPREEIAGIFEPRARGSNADKVEGSGIGLSLVARVVAAHGGSVAAESEEGAGTTITIRLPIQAS